MRDPTARWTHRPAGGDSAHRETWAGTSGSGTELRVARWLKRSLLHLQLIKGDTDERNQGIPILRAQTESCVGFASSLAEGSLGWCRQRNLLGRLGFLEDS